MADRRELALIAVERTRMPMVITDPRQADNPIVLANQAFLDLTGYAAEEVIGRNCRFLQGPQTEPQAIAAIRDAIATGADHPTFELLNYRKDGSTFWNQLVISPVRDDCGRLTYYFASQCDVTTERRTQALERSERLLLKEIDHRAMNVLALVQSIVRLTRPDTVARFSAQVESRIDTLARAHRLLADSGWAHADVVDVIAMEVPAGVRARVRTEGPPTPLRPQHVQPLALLVHELMANALEHGALAPSGDGELLISWTNAGGLISLNWSERGAVVPDRAPAPAAGLGLSLIRGVVERQLGGRLAMDWGGGGLAAELLFPSGTPAPGD